MNSFNESNIVSLFSTEEIKGLYTKNSRNNEDDFREVIFVEFTSGNKIVIKLASNGFTSIDRIRMWQKCIDMYIKEGYYCPKIYDALDGTFPTVDYKGHLCIVYAEEYSIYESAEKKTLKKPYRDSLYRMTAKIAKHEYDYTTMPSGYCLFDLFPGDQFDEVSENAYEFKKYCESLPERFKEQTSRMFDRWLTTYNELNKIYFKLPFSVFQADFNDTNVLLNKDGDFVGIMDFNLAGKDEFLNYLFREIIDGSFEEELNEILKALRIASSEYTFSDDEITAAQYIYRCVKPLWYTRVDDLKKAKDNSEAIEACLNEMEYAQTRVIDFRSVMTI